MIARRLVIRGRVQGVGYRYAMAEAVQARGVAGWVRNRSDGTVEAVLQGDAAAVEEAIAWCRRGPPLARVTAVEIATESVTVTFASFDLRSTV
jgi:acylphosphatase